MVARRRRRGGGLGRGMSGRAAIAVVAVLVDWVIATSAGLAGAGHHFIRQGRLHHGGFRVVRRQQRRQPAAEGDHDGDDGKAESHGSSSWSWLPNAGNASSSN